MILKVYPFMSIPFARKSHLHHSIQLKSLYSCENIFATHENFSSALQALKLWKIKHNRKLPRQKTFGALLNFNPVGKEKSMKRAKNLILFLYRRETIL